MGTIATARMQMPASTLWIMLLTLASTGITIVLACATPFTALAALAATQMRARDGVPLMLAAWAASQFVGFCVLGYPHDANTVAWAAALGAAAIACVIAARVAGKRLSRHGTLLQIAAAYLAASLVFKLVILLWSLGLGGVATALSPTINARQLIRNGTILCGLYALYRGLVAAGMPIAAREGSRPRELAR